MAERTTINVKGVEVTQWNRAKVCAQRSAESMGEWLSRAVRQLADAEASGPRELAPVQAGEAGLAAEAIPGNPPSTSMSAGELAGLMQGMATVTTATGIAPARADLRRAYGLADAMVRQAGGLPPRPTRAGKAGGQSSLKIGQSVMPALAVEPEPAPPVPADKRGGRKRKASGGAGAL